MFQTICGPFDSRHWDRLVFICTAKIVTCFENCKIAGENRRFRLRSYQLFVLFLARAILSVLTLSTARRMAYNADFGA